MSIAGLEAPVEEAEEDRLRDSTDEEGLAPTIKIMVGCKAIDQFALVLWCGICSFV